MFINRVTKFIYSNTHLNRSFVERLYAKSNQGLEKRRITSNFVQISMNQSHLLCTVPFI